MSDLKTGDLISFYDNRLGDPRWNKALILKADREKRTRFKISILSEGGGNYIANILETLEISEITAAYDQQSVYFAWEAAHDPVPIPETTSNIPVTSVMWTGASSNTTCTGNGFVVWTGTNTNARPTYYAGGHTPISVDNTINYELVCFIGTWIKLAGS